MKKTVRLISIQLLLLVLVLYVAFPGGYQLNEQGARATGMGGAFVARASDPSAVYYNPAGLAYQPGINTLLGVNVVIPKTRVTGVGIMYPSETATVNQIFTPINLYGSYEISDEIVVGLGIYNPFGLGTEWPLPWGQTLSGAWLGNGKLIKAEVQTWYINPSVAYKINDDLSIGLGISYVYATALRNAEFMQMDGSGSGINVNAGVIYKPMEKLSIGASYRMTTNLEFSGSIKFAGGLPISLFPGGTGKVTLPLPGTFLAGVAYELIPDLTIEGDVQYTQWSEYNQLKIEISPVILNGQNTITQVKKWEDAITARGGIEYRVDKDLTVRCGGVLDLSPQPPRRTEPMMPDGDRVDLTAGGSYRFNDNFSLDVGYMLVLFQERDAKNANFYGSPSSSEGGIPGIYKSTVHIISLNFGYTF